MPSFIKLTWPVIDVEAVSSLQNVGAAGPLLLNGSLANPSVPNQISFIGVNMIRSISLTSTNNLSGSTFVITGFQNNAPVTESLSGPNNNTVFGAEYYDIITSVTVNGAVNGIQVGTGDAGFFPLLVINTDITVINYSVSILLPAGSGVNYSLFQTLDQIDSNFIAFSNQTTKLFPAFGLTNETTSQLASSQDMANFILLKVNSSSTPVTDTFDFIFLQA